MRVAPYRVDTLLHTQEQVLQVLEILTNGKDPEIELLLAAMPPEKLLAATPELGRFFNMEYLAYRLHHEVKYPLPPSLAINVPSHPTRGIDFPGRCVSGQRFFVASFPGIYQLWWERLTVTPRLSSSCVFFPDGTEMFGKHIEDGCACVALYSNLSCFKDWRPCGRAPWGCEWFGRWRAMTRKCVEQEQKIVVVIKNKEDWQRDGVCWKAADGQERESWDMAVEGVGNSQRGEIEHLRSQYAGLPIKFVEVDEMLRLSALAAAEECCDWAP